MCPESPQLSSGPFSSIIIPWSGVKIWPRILLMNQKRFMIIDIFIVISITNNEVNGQTPSSCDSRNLNLSPFCNLTSTSSAMWLPSVLETYKNQTTSYVHQRTGPMRLKFPKSMEERELITSLTKVIVTYSTLAKTKLFFRNALTTMPMKTTLP